MRSSQGQEQPGVLGEDAVLTLYTTSVLTL